VVSMRFGIWWDRAVETPKRLDHDRPDVVVIDSLITGRLFLLSVPSRWKQISSHF